MSGHRQKSTTADSDPIQAQAELAAHAYPYGSGPLVPAWRDARSQLLAGCAVLAAAVATVSRWPIALAVVDDWALRVLFPAMLAFVLAFAPRPRTRVGRIARGLTVAALVAAIFAGRFVPVLIVCFPVLLAVSVVAGDTPNTRGSIR
jgi:hypothetical protein